MTEPSFRPGRELSAAFYTDVIEPLVRRHQHAAGLLGWGSDVLGYDAPRSTDHDWGPRLQVFVEPADVQPVGRLVAEHLPDSYAGWPTVFGSDRTAPQHRVEVVTLDDWLRGHLGIDPAAGLEVVDWMVIPQQQLLGVVRGAIHADPDGRLDGLRDLLAWYPDDVWLWLLACQWRRIDQEQPFVGRAAEAGDELGSRLLAGRMARELMRLAFLQERRYWPYSKWFGTAFAELDAADELSPLFDDAVAATGFPARESALVSAYRRLAERQNALDLHAPVDAGVRGFHDRPYQVIDADGFVQGCLSAVDDPWLRRQPLIGSVDQFADSTDTLAAPDRARRLAAAYVD